MNTARQIILKTPVLVCLASVVGCVTEQNSATQAPLSMAGLEHRVTNQWISDHQLMIENQLKARGITDLAVLNAMAEVPRHKFVPGSLKSSAYEDRPLPIGYQQTISQPYIVAYMTEILQPAAEHRVLEVGTGSGYQAAILSKLVKEVYSIEIVKELAESARQRLRTLGYNNVFVKTGNGYAGWTEHAPYDRIIITAAPPEIPEALIDQLASGGLLVGPVGVANQRIVIITRTGTGLSEKHTLPVRFVPMVGGSQN